MRGQVDMESQHAASLVIPVYEAAFMQPFRVQHLHRPAVTMPPHITVLTPAHALDTDLLAMLHHVCASYTPFSFTLVRTACFADPGVLYLVPEPTDALRMFHRTLGMYGLTDAHDDPVFHLTLAGWYPSTLLNSVEQEFHEQYGDHLPLAVRARDMCLYTQEGNTWIKSATFAFAEDRDVGEPVP